MPDMTRLRSSNFDHMTEWQMLSGAADSAVGGKGKGETVSGREGTENGIRFDRPGQKRAEESASAFLPG